MSLNVDGSSDAFYRYKMPKLAIKVEGKGNGIKTVLTNVVEIGKALSRKPDYPTKYFAMELGAQSIVDKKTDRYIVNGSHDLKHLQEILTGFIQKFVLCEACSNPETVLSVKKQGKSGLVMFRCKACGASGELSTKHKLLQYICKNPPEKEAPICTTETSSGNNKEGDDEASEEEGEVGMSPDSNMGNLEVPSVSVVVEDDSKVKWTVDGSDVGAQERMRELNTNVARLTMVPVDNSKTSSKKTLPDINKATDGEKAVMFNSCIGEIIKTISSGPGSRPVFGKEEIRRVHQESKRLKLSSKAVLCLMEKLFDNADTLLADVEANKLLLASFTQDEKSEQFVLIGIYLLIEKFWDKLLKKTAQILNAFYRCDILSESVILQWHEKGPSKSYIDKTKARKIVAQAKPFLDFLRTAEEESSEEEEEAEEETKKEVDEKEAENNNGKGSNDGQSDSDVDIDNI